MLFSTTRRGKDVLNPQMFWIGDKVDFYPEVLFSNPQAARGAGGGRSVILYHSHSGDGYKGERIHFSNFFAYFLFFAVNKRWC